MPSRTTCALIFLLWLFSTGWLISRDLLPSLGLGQITYERALASRAVEEPVDWTIFRDEEEVGHLFFSVHPKPNSTFELESRAHLRVPLTNDRPMIIDINSIIYVNPLKELDHFGVVVSLSGSNTEIHVDGEPKEDTLALGLTLRVGGQEQFKRSMQVPFNRRAMLLDVFGQLDRLPDLRPGKVWQTQFVNPLSSLVGGDLLPVRTMDSIQNTVVGIEEIEWSKEKVACYKVEHRYQQALTSSWARVSDGKVLVQEVMFGGDRYRLVAERSTHDRLPDSESQEKK
jgi:hypothetical protein